jgi:hypothetical protein
MATQPIKRRAAPAAVEPPQINRLRRPTTNIPPAGRTQARYNPGDSPRCQDELVSCASHSRRLVVAAGMPNHGCRMTRMSRTCRDPMHLIVDKPDSRIGHSSHASIDLGILPLPDPTGSTICPHPVRPHKMRTNRRVLYPASLGYCHNSETSCTTA